MKVIYQVEEICLYAQLFEHFYSEKVINFVIDSSVNQDDDMHFFPFVLCVQRIVLIELFSKCWNIIAFFEKFYLVMVFNLFNILLDSSCYYFLRIFASIEGILVCIILFWGYFVWLWCKGNAGFIDCIKKCSLSFCF